MVPMLIMYLGIGGAGLVAHALLRWSRRVNRILAALVTLVLAFVGAYSLSFVIDMWLQVPGGTFAAGTLVWPTITWSLVVISAVVPVLSGGVSRWAAALPFFILGGIAMAGTFITSRHAITGIVLFSIAATIATALGHGAESGSTATAERKARRGRAPRLGPYGLGMRIKEVPSLIELSAAERKALQLAIEFRDERIYHAPPGTFGEIEWSIILGAVDGKVYKISALAAAESRELRDRIGLKTTEVLRSELGAPATSQPSLWIWDTEDGNVVLNFADAGGQHAVVMTVTSGEVSGFARIS